MYWIRVYCIFYLVGLFGLYSSLNVGSLSLSSFLYPVLYSLSIFLFFQSNFNKYKYEFFVWSSVFLFGIVLSSLLSYDPILSLMSISYLIFNLIFVYIVVRNIENKELLKLIYNALKVMTVIGFFFFIINRSIVIYIDPIERPNIFGFFNYKGLYTHKITAGIYNVIGVILAYGFFTKGRSTSDLVWLFTFTFLCLISGSSLGVFSLLLIFLFLILFKYLYPFFKLRYIAFVGGFFLFSIFIFSNFSIVPALLKFLGRDENLTGRTFIWEFGFNYILDNPLLGSGFALFFNPDNLAAPAQFLWDEMIYYSAPSFHNGFIQLMAETGLLGSAVFFSIFLFILIKFLYLKSKIYSSLLILCFVVNFGASLLVTPNTFFFFLIFYCFFSIIFYKNPRLQNL